MLKSKASWTSVAVVSAAVLFIWFGIWIDSRTFCWRCYSFDSVKLETISQQVELEQKLLTMAHHRHGIVIVAASFGRRPLLGLVNHI